MQSQSFSGVPNFDGTFTFDEFNAADFGDPADVNLLSVEIIATATIENGLLELDNDGLDPASATAELGANVVLSSTDIPLALPNVSPSTMAAFGLGPNNGDDDSSFQSEPGDPDYSFLDGSNVSESNNAVYNQPLAAVFEGAGTFDIDYDVDSIFDTGGIGGVSFAGTPVDATIEVKVIYNYEIIPTPGATGLLGLAGIAALRRRR